MATIGWHSEDGWFGDPAPVTVSAGAGLTCPQCQRHVSHLQVIIYEPEPVSFEIWDMGPPRVTGYTVTPCLHEVPVREYTLIMRDGFMSFEPKEIGHVRTDRST